MCHKCGTRGTLFKCGTLFLFTIVNHMPPTTYVPQFVQHFVAHHSIFVAHNMQFGVLGCLGRFGSLWYMGYMGNWVRSMVSPAQQVHFMIIVHLLSIQEREKTVNFIYIYILFIQIFKVYYCITFTLSIKAIS